MNGSFVSAEQVQLLIIGPQGSGKGTQGARVAAHAGVPAISTGDMFRDHIARQTELGTRMRQVIEAGEFAPDELTEAIVRQRLSEADAIAGFLLDGYPRNLTQVGDLDRVLEERSSTLTSVIELQVPREESIERLALRAAEQNRTDDTAEVIARRLATYERETAPILEVYQSRGLVDGVDGTGTLDDVTGRILAALEARGVHPTTS